MATIIRTEAMVEVAGTASEAVLAENECEKTSLEALVEELQGVDLA